MCTRRIGTVRAAANGGDTLLLYLAANNPYRRQTPEAAAAAARVLLDNGADSEAATARGQTPLGRAAKNGHTALARLLIEKEAYVNAATDDGRTPLLESLWAGHREIAAALITAGADPSQAVQWGPNGDFPLKAAASRQDTAMVGMLIEAGATLDPDSRDLCDLLRHAAPYPEMVRLITASSVDLNRRDPLNRYPLKVIMRKGPPESVAIMIAAGADPSLVGHRGQPPLIHFAETGQVDLVRACLDNNPPLRQNRKQLKKAMYMAIRKAHPAVVRELMHEGLFYKRIEEVEAILAWARVPPATPEDKAEILAMFKQRLPQAPPRPASSPILQVTPSGSRP